MISDEWEEEYYVKVNEDLEQVEVRFFSKVDRLVFAQSYSSSSPFSFDEAKTLCDRICGMLTDELENEKHYLGGNHELQGMGCKPVWAEDD